MRTIVVSALLGGGAVSASSQKSLSPDVHNDVESQATWSSLKSAWEGYIQHVMTEWHAPGLAIAVINGSETWNQGFGVASLETGEAVTPHTLFATGSTTKSFISAGLSLLIDNSSDYDGISWDTPISHVLRDDFVLSDEWATEAMRTDYTQHITFEDALSHRTGYPGHGESIHNSSTQVVRSLRHLPLSSSSRTRFEYNNMMYVVVGHALTTLTGLDLTTFLHQHLWVPMDMHETFLEVYDPWLNGRGLTRASSYAWSEQGAYVLDTTLDGHLYGLAAAGAVYSNVADYTKYLRIMLAEAGPMSKAGHREVKMPRSFMDFNKEMFITPTMEWYGLAWMAGVFEGEHAYWHTGTVNNMVTYMLIVPSREIGIVVMANSRSKVRELVTYRVLYDLFGIDEARRPDHEAHFRESRTREREHVATCSQRLYPDLPRPPLPATLPLGAYRGTYSHPGYGNLFIGTLDELEANNSGLSGLLSSSSLQENKMTLYIWKSPEAASQILGKLEHKTGEHWMTYISTFNLPEEVDYCSRTEFRVGVDGHVKQVGVDLRMEMDDTPLVWFDRL
ncbi:beta-lactamase/transpeptidase-like protein [Coniella lustricola]|uniref:Beta-lactamase/transpeptidase-like protein n=1 Tax=Coniella lustricola TaxID=2025994 RepID=A0A2T3AGR9_9PEZI|nr:beta-lactamase/transpeptidase-like protein [Coniella lustricola]